MKISQTKKMTKQPNENMHLKVIEVLIIWVFKTSQPELKLKDIESATKNKLEELQLELRGFKSRATSVSDLKNRV